MTTARLVPTPVPTVPTVPPVVPVVPTPVLGPVLPLPSAQLLGTKKGIGTPGGPCRVHPDVRIDLPVLGRGGVPATGVAAVVLRVQLISPDAVGTVHLWPAGSTMPVESLPLDAAGRTADVTVPRRYVGQREPAAQRRDGTRAGRPDRLGRGCHPSDLLRPRRTLRRQGFSPPRRLDSLKR